MGWRANHLRQPTIHEPREENRGACVLYSRRMLELISNVLVNIWVALASPP